MSYVTCVGVCPAGGILEGLRWAARRGVRPGVRLGVPGRGRRWPAEGLTQKSGEGTGSGFRGGGCVRAGGAGVQRGGALGSARRSPEGSA